MPTALLAPVLSSVLAAALPMVTACDIDQAYAARDACLARNATERALAGASTHARAQALALACAAQTDRLITASSRGDAAVASAIRDDTEFRALGVMLRTPGAN